MTLISREILQERYGGVKKNTYIAVCSVHLCRPLAHTHRPTVGRTSGGTCALLGGAKPFGEHKHQVSAGFLAGTDIRQHCNVYPLGCFASISLRYHKVQKRFPYVPCLFSRYRDNAVYHRQRAL